MTEKRYFSWIPTVSGRLSYSFFGHSAWPRRCLYANHIGDSQQGQAIFFQERFCDDFTFPLLGRLDRVRSFIFGLASKLHFPGVTSGRHFFVAVVDKVTDHDKPLDMLEGRIFPILAVPIGKRIASKIREDILSISRSDPIEQARQLSDYVLGISRAASGVCPVVVGFRLRRDGITELWPIEAHHVPEGYEVSAPLVTDYVEQSFFFLRDIGHVHQHHDPASDTIVRVHDSESTFMKKIYFDLFRAIIKFKRIRSAENIMNASGILAYAMSFKNIKGPGEKVPTDYQVENLKASLDAAQFQLDHKSQQRSNSIALVLTTIFAIFGAIISITALFDFAPEAAKTSIQLDPTLIYVTSFIAENPIAAFGLCIILSYFVLFFFGQLKPNRYPFFEDIQRLFQHVPRWLFISTLMAGGGSLVLIAVLNFFV